MWEAIAEFCSIQTVEVDVTNAYCPLGCCRMAYVRPIFPADFALRQLRIVGLRHDDEVNEWRSK